MEKLVILECQSNCF